MKKKLLLAFSFAVMAFVLAGCISIPIGDSVLELSTDGVEFTSENNESDSENTDNMMNDEEEQETNNEGLDGSSEVTNASNGDAGSSDSLCTEPEDHSEFFKNIDDDVFIPECATLIEAKHSDSKSDGHFELVGGDWSTVKDEYEDHYKDKEVSEGIELDIERARYTVKLGDTKVDFDINQKDGFVTIDARYRHPN